MKTFEVLKWQTIGWGHASDNTTGWRVVGRIEANSEDEALADAKFIYGPGSSISPVDPPAAYSDTPKYFNKR